MEIMRDPLFLAQKSGEAAFADIPTARELLKTLIEHRAECVGMAANMIGVRKRIIAFQTDNGYGVMLNPVITAKKGEYEAEEGCLSLSGTRKAVRYKRITVAYRDMRMLPRTGVFEGYTAQIIQHEIDHCNGVLI